MAIFKTLTWVNQLLPLFCYPLGLRMVFLRITQPKVLKHSQKLRVQTPARDSHPLGQCLLIRRQCTSMPAFRSAADVHRALSWLLFIVWLLLSGRHRLSPVPNGLPSEPLEIIGSFTSRMPYLMPRQQCQSIATLRCHQVMCSLVSCNLCAVSSMSAGFLKKLRTDFW